MTLTGMQRQQIKQALIGALSGGMSDLEQVVDVAFNINVYTIIPMSASFGEAVYKVVAWADARTLAHVLRLLVAAGDVNNANEQLIACRDIIAQAVGPQPTAAAAYQYAAAGQLERILHKAADFADVVKWRSQMEKREAAICRIEVPDGCAEGTGFLVGPDLLITNYHVFDAVWSGKTQAADVVCRFDYKKAEDGISVSAGRVSRLAPVWDIVKGGEADNDLDFALARLADAPGRDATPVAGGAARQWLTPQSQTLAQGDPLCILQHPMGNPLSVAFAEIQQASGVQNYVVHDVNTQPGSSGSPCFDAQWNLVALHYYGALGGNRAFPFTAILPQIQAHLTSR